MGVKKSIVFDLDGTICFPNFDKTMTAERYGQAKPNRAVIEYMRILREKGFHITIYTARRMVTHGGNLPRIIDDVSAVTVEWLKTYSVPYDLLKFGKPYSSTFYVDDKAMTMEDLSEWMATV